ncbi:hypothetical protein RND71_043687 [Anisodus tanguticus]|uniref:Uncharacterized protein n=1 Tax=Anisodus tanguticus TaxID=243964 RepID=A0AAE1QNS3_9SOLA|nr:hypothetical protein RND71_043687 [Anisodus tanguticus]
MNYLYFSLNQSSISSSAPVQAKLDFVEYMEVVGDSLGKECSLKVKSAMEEVKSALKTPEGVKKIREMFNVCSFDITDKKTVQNFYSNIVDSFAGVVQYNEDNRLVNGHIKPVMNLVIIKQQLVLTNLSQIFST